MRKLFFLLLLLLFFSFTLFAQDDDSKTKTNSGIGFGNSINPSTEKGKTSSVMILSKPRINYTSEAREKGTEGEVLLRITFLASREIGSVSIVKALPYGLTEQAIAAAKQMKFKPAIKNGVPYSVTKTVSFDFQLIDYISANSIDEKAKAVMDKAVEKLGGEGYLNVKTLVGEGKFSLLKDGRISSYQDFMDIIVYPNKERTDFTEKGSKTVQVNTGETGWIYDEFLRKFGDQNEKQVKNFKLSMKTHYDYLLRGKWMGAADLVYVGRKPSTLGKRNDVLKLSFEGGLEIEYEFDDKGLPMKTSYIRMNAENQAITEETRYSRFIAFQGILFPSIVDHFTKDEHTFRVVYESIEFNKTIPNEIFEKPENPKKLNKKLKF